MISVPNRSANTILPILERWISPDAACIITDEWRAYRQIETRLGITHFKVNHSTNFVNPNPAVVQENGGMMINVPIHTQTVEGYWSQARRMMKRRGGIRLRHLQGHIKCE